ncbi:MAG: CoA-binding protein [Bacteroidales bacterium]|nr:CoA-binding protein [Bacteroidales bacterium]
MTNTTSKTLVVGASENPVRFANKAVKLLRSYNHEVMAFGLRQGKIADVEIQTIWPEKEFIDTITLYIGPQRQPDFYNKILDIKPKRIIFNPGTENPELIRLAQDAGIETVLDCTLVMLETGTF